MKGEVIYFYAFDVANEIAVTRVGQLLGRPPAPMGLSLKHAAPKDVAFHRPLAVEPEPLASHLADREVRCQVHIFEIGVVNVTLRATFEESKLVDLLRFHQPVLDDGRCLDDVAAKICADACRDLGAALVRPSQAPDPEAYTIFRLTDLGSESDAAEWLAEERTQIAALLCGLTPERLSEAQVADSLRLHWSLERNDLVVIDWDAAVVVDLAGNADEILYVLEVANLQLEEFRTMDQSLDRYLNQAYEDLEQRRAGTLLGSTAAMLRKLRWFRIDLTKLADEVTNITKFFGDWYLARVYLGARERFHLDRWRGSVEGRLSQLDQLYGVAHSELFERRLLWLELIMLVFFAIDLVAIFIGRR